MFVIVKVIGIYEIVVMGIDSSPLASAEELITFKVGQ
jgi:hypothetical protein